MNSSGLFCTKCGELNEASAKFCRRCGAPQPSAGTAAEAAPTTGSPADALRPTAWPTGSAAGSYRQPPPPPVIEAPGYAPVSPVPTFRGYGGFWIRVLALLIDGAVISAALIPVQIIFGGAMAAMGGGMRSGRIRHPEEAMLVILPMVGVYIVTALVVSWLYEALLTSSSKQATLGKMALGLKVIDKQGERLSFWHATGRYCAKWVNSLTLGIGWLVAGFSARKQGLHDMIAGTYVVRS